MMANKLRTTMKVSERLSLGVLEKDSRVDWWGWSGFLESCQGPLARVSQIVHLGVETIFTVTTNKDILKALKSFRGMPYFYAALRYLVFWNFFFSALVSSSVNFIMSDMTQKPVFFFDIDNCVRNNFCNISFTITNMAFSCILRVCPSCLFISSCIFTF